MADYSNSAGMVRAAKRERTSQEVQNEKARRASQEELKAEKEKQKRYLGTEITDASFIKDPEQNVLVFPKELYKQILEIMCYQDVTDVLDEKSDAQLLIERLLAVPRSHKDIQILENLGIKKLYFEEFILNCGIDLDTIYTEIFILKNLFFTREEVLENFGSENSIPFYNPEVLIDADQNALESGFSISSRSKIANLPSEILTKSMEEKIDFVDQRFERLKLAVREDFFKRSMMANRSDNLRTLKPKGNV